MYNNIPDEMKFLNQWLVWRYEETQGAKPTKVPYCPRTGLHADVSDPATWCSFNEAVNAVKAGSSYSGIGFVFTANDPYTGIDLDVTQDPDLLARQHKIYAAFNSYSEFSPSGKGLHIIIKANIPAGRKRGSVEIYSDKRFFTMTGNVYNGMPIAERQALAQILYEEMTTHAQVCTYGGDPIEREPDTAIIQKALAAVNGDKFKALLEGQWQNYYPSQSEADFAFVDIISFYTQNPIQISRIFRSSPLGERDKAKRNDYVAYMINKSFDRQLPPVNIEGLKQDIIFKQQENAQQQRDLDADERRAAQLVHQAKQQALNLALPNARYDVPPPVGLVGDIAQFIYNQAPRQVAQIAVAAAIGLMAGICGRAYNISGTGLNQYVALLAPTGTGKEAMASGIDAIMAACMMHVPSARDFVGPAGMASGQALTKYLANDSKCFVSIIGEFGHFMRQLSTANASSSQIALRMHLLDLYNKSGKGKVLGKTIYSDKEKSTNAITSPSFTILGESTPESFYGTLDEGMISEGLLPRFLMIEYHGERPPLNPYHRSHKPSEKLIQDLVTLLVSALQLNSKNEVIEVQQDDAALAFTQAFDKYADKKINTAEYDRQRQLWNRAHIKLLKLAALIAVGVNPYQPTITLDIAEWARNVVVNDIENLLLRFEKGDVGKDSEETKQANDVLRVVREYLSQDYATTKKYYSNAKMHADKVIPNAYINKRLVAAASFRLDRMGATNALNRTIKTLIETGVLREVGRNDLSQKYNTSQRAYVLADTSVL